MGLQEFYKLRNDFILIGLTGRMRGGAHEVADILNKEENPFDCKEVASEILKIKDDNINEGLKYQNLQNFNKKNWRVFNVIRYKNVVLLHLLHVCRNDDPKIFAENILSFILKLGEHSDYLKNERFGSTQESKSYCENYLKEFLLNSTSLEVLLSYEFKGNSLNNCLEEKGNGNEKTKIYDFFFSAGYQNFSTGFFAVLDRYSHVTRIRLLHILSFYLRVFGILDIKQIVDAEIKSIEFTGDLSHVYTTAKTIKYIVKSSKHKIGYCNIVLDSLKNSFEINYFRERFSGFYLLAINKDDQSREDDLYQKVLALELEQVSDEVEKCKKLDEKEYQINDFKKGGFASPDIENCIQKSDYHIFIEKKKYCVVEEDDIVPDSSKAAITVEKSLKVNLRMKDRIGKSPENNKNNKKNEFTYHSLNLQLLKLICLIKQPGIVTPAARERIMQIAFNAKLNSGCISRQVGAVVTDQFYSVKGIGWNEVPEGQTPCSLRDINHYKDSLAGENAIYTDFEKKGKYDDKESFIAKMKSSINAVPKDYKNQENGRNCPYCFKTFHNAFEGKDNQVHTRSLHAEENAMLQITKYGGQGLKGGNLFTTASPCELCSKKAYQLGINNIFYIDPYPGISKQQVLKGGNRTQNNPNLYMYQGAIGRGFNKLYEPMMSLKDETIIRTGIKPVESDRVKLKTIKKILEKELEDDKETINKLDSLLVGKDGIKDFVSIIKEGLEKSKKA